MKPIPNRLNDTFSEISRDQDEKSKFLIYENVLIEQFDNKAKFADFWILSDVAGFSSAERDLMNNSALNVEE